ncbi:MAG: hypothetical protein II329_02695 [Clostridia bacterium]|nr:hypothetical protein [Clostridia bacterium]
MKIINNPETRKKGKISFAGREIILFSIDIPQCDDEDNILNGIFRQSAENYEKYLEKYAEKEIFPRLKIMLESGKRSREIRDALGVPINASLVWKFCFFKEKYLSLRCETRLTYFDGRCIFTLKTLNFDSENMILKKAKYFSKKARAKRQNFYIQGSKLYTFEKNYAVSENYSAKTEEIVKIHPYKIDNI